MKTTRHSPSSCPHCGDKVNASTSVGHDSAPAPGDITVCIGCAGVSEFDADLQLAPLDVAKLDPENARTVARTRALILAGRPS